MNFKTLKKKLKRANGKDKKISGRQNRKGGLATDAMDLCYCDVMHMRPNKIVERSFQRVC